MFIQTEETPNPDALKFLPQMTVMSSGRVVSFRVGADGEGEARARAESPLAAEILAIPGVVGVMLGGDFVAVTKGEDRSFDDLKPLILLVMMEYIMQGAPFYIPPKSAASETPQGEVEAKICALIDARVRPAVAADGGDITFARFEDGVVYVSMQGACAGCPSSTLTLKQGIETMLKHYIPEVREVRAEDPWM